MNWNAVATWPCRPVRWTRSPACRPARRSWRWPNASSRARAATASAPHCCWSTSTASAASPKGKTRTAGDLVLREIASQHPAATLRGADALARFGHAQLAVFLAQADPLGALDVAERIRERIEQLEIAWRDQACGPPSASAWC
jgi:hypothetical protein